MMNPIDGEALPPYAQLDDPQDEFDFVASTDEDFGGSDDILVIGIDFGTTNSGVAWATLDDIQKGQPRLVHSWPGTSREEAKAPTELFYEDGKTLWGYEVPNDADPVRWFKLLLLKEEDLGEDIRSSEQLLRARKMLKENGKSPVQLIADYLGKLWQHALRDIETCRGETVVDALRFHIVITVPAIWKGYARQGMEEAARQAGLLERRSAGRTTLSFAPEPEAAALATLSEPGRVRRQGDVFLVCDAGGGTVDLISYKILSEKPIQLAEVVEGTGGLCGGIFVDQEFERICKSRLGRKWDKLSKAGINEVLKREWETGIKPQFKPVGGTKKYTVSIPPEAFTGSSTDDTSREPIIRNGRIHFGETHLEEAFGEVFSMIDKLVDGQINKSREKGFTVSGLILVGGLGCSPYLYDHLRSRYESAGIQLLQSSGIKPRSAICRGAVYKGFLDCVDNLESVAKRLPVSVASTIARASYGTDFQEPFDPTRHSPEEKVWDRRGCEFVARGRMDWFLSRGENVSKKTPVRHPYYMLYDVDFGGVMVADILTCDDEEPPARKTLAVKTLCDVEGKVNVPFQSLPVWTNPEGREFRRLEFELEMIPSGATLEFNVSMDGKKLGLANTAIRF